MTGRRLLLAVALTLAPSAAPAQRVNERRNPDGPQPVPEDGTEVFRWLFREAGIEPVRATELKFGDPPPNVIVVVLGTSGDEHEMVRGIAPLEWAARAVESGGAVLVASDTHTDVGRRFRFGREDRDGPSRLVIEGSTVRATQPGTYYGGRSECPLIVGQRFVMPGSGPEQELFRGLSRVVTNQPSFFRPSVLDPPFRSIARLPPGSQTTDPLSSTKVSQNLGPFAVAGSGSFGGNPFRVLALADPSVFINQTMIWTAPGEPQPDNLEFARRVVAYLSEENGKQVRNRCLFIQNGRVVDQFGDLQKLLTPPPPPIPFPDLGAIQDKLVDAGNQLIDRAQQNDVPTKLLLGRTVRQQTSRVKNILTGLVMAAGTLAVLFMLRRVWGARQPGDVPPPPPAGRPAGVRPGGLPDGVFDRRERELLRRNNLYEPVRMAVREMFMTAGAPADVGPKFPGVAVAGVVNRPDTLRRALADLWKIAYGRPQPLTAARWAALEPLFVRARQAHADGKWWFEGRAGESGQGGEV